MVEVAAVGALLAPALPYLLKSTEDVAARASEALGDAVWKHAKRLWDRLGGRLGDRPGALEDAAELAEQPDDEILKTVFTRHLGKVLEADPALAAEVEQLLAEASAAGVVSIALQGDGNFVNTGKIADGTFILGDGNTVGRG